MVVVLVFYNEVGYLPASSVAAAGQWNSNPNPIQSNEVWRAQVEPLCPHLQQL